VLKKPHPRWSRFMLLSYPNDGDRQRYAMALSEGQVPVVDGQARARNAVGIHGTDRLDANARGVDWTWGCVSMFNSHIEELYELIPVGTPVLIQELGQPSAAVEVADPGDGEDLLAFRSGVARPLPGAPWSRGTPLALPAQSAHPTGKRSSRALQCAGTATVRDTCVPKTRAADRTMAWTVATQRRYRPRHARS